MSFNDQNRLKIVIIGDSNVGKTNIINAIIKKTFDEEYDPSHSAKFFESSVIIDTEEVAFRVWDTPGQREHKYFIQTICRNSHCCILVYDVTNIESFEHIREWIDIFNEENKSEYPSIIPFLLLGNKCDLDNKEVDFSMASDFAKENGNMQFYEVSAKSGEYIEKLFQQLINRSIIIEKKKLLIQDPTTSFLISKIEEQSRENTKQREMIDSIISICQEQSRNISELMEFNNNLQNQSEIFQQEMKDEVANTRMEINKFESFLKIVSDHNTY